MTDYDTIFVVNIKTGDFRALSVDYAVQSPIGLHKEVEKELKR